MPINKLPLALDKLTSDLIVLLRMFQQQFKFYLQLNSDDF